MRLQGDPTFIILKRQAWMEAADFEEQLLGAIIKHPLSPSTDFVPYKDPKSPGSYKTPRKYMICDPQTGTDTSFVLLNKANATREFATTISSIGGFSLKGNNTACTNLAGQLVRFKRIRQLEPFWDNFKKDAQVEEQAPKWVSIFNKRPACLVVGIMICDDVELAVDGEQSEEFNVDVEIPVGQITMAAGAPNPAGDLVDPKFSLKLTQGATHTFKAKVKGSHIFAIELKKVSTKLFQRVLKLKGDWADVEDDTRLAADDLDDSDLEALGEPVEGEDMILDELTLRELDNMEDSRTD